MTHDGSEPHAEPDPQLEALRQAFCDEPTSAAEGHASSEEVTALVEGALAPERARELASKALDDPDLALEIRVAAALRSAREHDEAQDHAQGHAEPESAAANSGRYRRWLITSVLAAVAAVAVFVIIRPDTPSFTNEGTPAIRGEPTGALQPTSPSAKLPRDAFTLEWTGGPEAATAG